MPAPSLTGFLPSITLDENTVNATPQLLDGDVVFTDAEGDFDGGVLTLSGLLAEDRVSVRHEGFGVGQIGLSGANLTFGGLFIGTFSGGIGGTLTIIFNASAGSAAIDAVIQNLTYANVSETPTASRDLVLNITDAAGNTMPGAPAFAQQTGVANPVEGIIVSSLVVPSFADLDGDGDRDLVFGTSLGTVAYAVNTGTASAPVFALQSGAANPFNGINVGNRSNPTLADLDGDGDLDAVVGDAYGTLRYFQNTGTAAAPAFTEVTGGANPLNGVDVGYTSAPTFADLDGDGDLDAVVGATDGTLRYFQNTGTASAAVFVQQTGAANPLNGVDIGYFSTPILVDVDGDGDRDAVVGSDLGGLSYFENTGTASAAVFVQRTGADNPFNGVSVGTFAAPALADIDGDGDMDTVVGASDGNLRYYQNVRGVGQTISVTVTAQNDAPTQTGLPTDVTVVEDVASDLDLSAVTLSDVDNSGDIAVVLTASTGTMTATSGAGVTVTGSTSGVLTLTGTVAAIDAFLNTASAVRYTGATNASGDNAATVTITADDGAVVQLGVVNVDITAVDDPGIAVDDDAGTVNENAILGGNVFAANGGAADSDPDSPLTISHINGVAAVFGSQITLASGAILTIEPDGEFTYTAGSAFRDLSGPTSGGSNQQRFDSFTYTLTGGGTATVTVRVTGLDSDGDLLTGGAGDDTLDGGAGRDRLSYIGAGAGVTVDLNVVGSQNTGGGGSPTIVRIEDLTGSAFDDVLTGLTGFGSSLIGLAGDDRLIGGAGDNVLDGGAGNDTADYSAVTNPVTVDLTLVGPQNTVSAGMDTLIGIENLNGSFSGDFFTGDSAANLLFGNDGEDVLLGGGGNDTLNGGAEFDVLFGGTGDDLLFGDEGDDRLFDDVGDDTMDGGEGVDRAFYWMATAGVTVDLAVVGAQNTGGAGTDTLISIEQLVGSDFNDVLSGRDDEDNLLDGRSGDDVLNGRGGNDLLDGGEGDDTLNGGAGDDVMYGGLGNDTLNGGAGIDTVSYEGVGGALFLRLGGGTSTDGEGGTDTLTGIENVIGSDNADTVIGSSVANRIQGGSGRDVLVGLGGNDTLEGGSGDPNTLIGGTGDDTYVVDANDTVVEFSGEGTDTIQTSRTTYVLKTHFENLQYTGSSAFRGTGNAANNSLEGGSGNDVLIGRGGNDLLDGNSGTDTADYTAAAGGVTASLFDGAASNDGDGGTDALSEIENLTGSTFADSLTGDAVANVLDGGSGNDVLAGRGGNDVLRGGAGIDTADYSGAAAGVTIKLAPNTAGNDGDGGTDSFSSIENLTGSAFNDVISGDGLVNVISGGLGGDVLLGLGGNDTLIGGAGAGNTLQGGLGDDTYVVSANDTIVELASQGTDTVQTDRAFLTLAGNIENLTYTGSAAFQGTGNALANVITGGAANDTLIGGMGDDMLNGGGGTADYMVVQGLLADYTVTDLGGGGYRIVDATAGRDGTDATTGIERIRFADGTTRSLASLAGGGAPLEPVDKTSGEPQVLPDPADDDFLTLAKDGDRPLVLPGDADGLDLPGTPDILTWTGDFALTVDQDGGLVSGTGFAGRHDHDAWLF